MKAQFCAWKNKNTPILCVKRKAFNINFLLCKEARGSSVNHDKSSIPAKLDWEAELYTMIIQQLLYPEAEQLLHIGAMWLKNEKKKKRGSFNRLSLNHSDIWRIKNTKQFQLLPKCIPQQSGRKR